MDRHATERLTTSHLPVLKCTMLMYGFLFALIKLHINSLAHYACNGMSALLRCDNVNLLHHYNNQCLSHNFISVMDT